MGPYRIIYELLEDERVGSVIAIGHRRDVYVVQRKPTASGRGARGLAGSSPLGSSSL
jgi:hypothetical protein